MGVKVRCRLEGVGALPKEAVAGDFQPLSFSLKVHGYNGANWRLQVPRLSEEIIPDECSVRCTDNSVLVKLRKKKEDHFWFELHKTKGVGEETAKYARD